MLHIRVYVAVYVHVCVEGGRVCVWGDGRSDGSLGVGAHRCAYLPYFLLKFREVIIKHIYTSHTHSAAVSDDGYVYTWGSSMHGALGHVSHMQQSSGAKVASTQLTPNLIKSMTERSVLYT